MVNKNTQIENGIQNTLNWIANIEKTVSHMSRTNKCGYFFKKDIEDLQNSIAQAKLSCYGYNDYIMTKKS